MPIEQLSPVPTHSSPPEITLANQPTGHVPNGQDPEQTWRLCYDEFAGYKTVSGPEGDKPNTQFPTPPFDTT